MATTKHQQQQPADPPSGLIATQIMAALRSYRGERSGTAAETLAQAVHEATTFAAASGVDRSTASEVLELATKFGLLVPMRQLGEFRALILAVLQGIVTSPSAPTLIGTGPLLEVFEDSLRQIRPVDLHLTRIRRALSLSMPQLGRILGVTGESVRRWLRNPAATPPQRAAEIGEIARLVGELERMIDPRYLPEIVRRRAPIFDGRTALDLALEGKLDEVVEKYAATFSYQG